MVRRLRIYSRVQELGEAIALDMTCFSFGLEVRVFGSDLLRLQLCFPCSQHFGRI